MHVAAYAFIARSVPDLPDGPVLEIGSRNVNGSIRSLFAGREYIGVDVAPGSGVDIVADGATYRPEVTPAVIVCCETAEHTPYAKAICRHAHELLAPGGVLLLTAAGVGRPAHSAVDGGPLRPGEFYANVTAEELSDWLEDFAISTIETNPRDGDIYAFARKGLK